ncbi:MAG: TolC family protein [Pseudomonadota bacterium]
MKNIRLKLQFSAPAALLLLLGCASDNAEQRAIGAPGAVTAFGPPPSSTSAALAVAAGEAATSPTSRELARRYSPEAASGKSPLWKSVRMGLPEISTWQVDMEETPAPYDTPDAAAAPLSFDAAVKAAMVNSIEAALANEALNKSEIAAVNAVFGYLPSITATGEFNRVRQDVIRTDNAVFQAGVAEFNVLNGRVEATQPLLDFSSLLAIRVADTAEKATERAYIAAVQGSAFDAATAYLLALEAKAKLDSVTARSGLLAQQVAVEDDLIEFGLSTPATRQLLEVQIGQTEVERLQYQQEYDTAVVSLGKLIGQTVTDLVDMRAGDQMLQTAALHSTEDLVRKALRDNPDMQQRRLATLQQRQEVRRQFAEDFAPTVNLFASAEYEDRAASRFGGGSVTFDQNFGVRVSVPLFNANGTGYQSFEEQSDLRAAVLSETLLRRELDIEVRSLDQRLKSLRGLIGKADRAVSAATDLLSSARRSVESGVATELLVLRHRIQEENAREWQARSNYVFLRNWARLAFLTGNRFVPQ